MQAFSAVAATAFVVFVRVVVVVVSIIVIVAVGFAHKWWQRLLWLAFSFLP